MKNFAKTLGLAAIALVAVQLPGQAETATRGAYAEVRPNGSSFAASFETVVPDATPTIVLDPILNVVVNAPGTNQSDLDSIQVAGVSYDSVTTGLETIEAAIARQIDATSFTLAEDITGFIRAFVGPEGFSGADASATLD